MWRRPHRCPGPRAHRRTCLHRNGDRRPGSGFIREDCSIAIAPSAWHSNGGRAGLSLCRCSAAGGCEAKSLPRAWGDLDMSRLFAGLVAMALLCITHATLAAPAAPGSVESVPPRPAPPAAAPPPPAIPPAATPVPSTAPAVPPPATAAPAAATTATPTPPPPAAAAPPSNEAAATTQAKPKKKKRRYARYGFFGYPHYRSSPFYHWHPRFWWPFKPQRYRYARQQRRAYYYRPFWR